MAFDESKFETGEVVFPGLDLAVFLDNGRYFRNDGIVPDVETHRNKVLRELGVSSTPEKTEDGKQYGGYVFSLSDTEEAAVIFISDWNDETNIFNYGHESTHVLIRFGLEACFIDLLKEQGFTLNPFQGHYTEEFIADVGGLVSLYKAGQFGAFREHPEVSPLLDELMRSRKS